MDDSACAILTAGHCPTCNARGFVLGPRRRGAQHIECANLDCRARFNITNFVGGEVILAESIPRESEGGVHWPSAPRN